MQITNMNWMDVEKSIKKNPKCILPIGSTEQHAQLSLCVDMILAEKISIDAAEPYKIPVFPVIPYGIAPYFSAYPGTISLRIETLISVVKDIIFSFRKSGFKQILIVNGHGGNNPIGSLSQELMSDYSNISIKFHNWWNAPKTWEKVQTTDKSGSHANWMENFPWTRLAHSPSPKGKKEIIDMDLMKASSPEKIKVMLKDGSLGGPWKRSDKEMLEIWETGVKETREALLEKWPENV